LKLSLQTHPMDMATPPIMVRLGRTKKYLETEKTGYPFSSSLTALLLFAVTGSLQGQKGQKPA